MTVRQPALFDPARTLPQACPVPGCQTIRTPGQTGHLITCAHDRDLALGQLGKRPKHCLNRIDNAHQEIPY